MNENEKTTLRALRVACGISPDSWVEAWEIEPFLPITMHVTTDAPWFSDSGGFPRQFAGAWTAWRWRSGQQVVATLSHLRRKGLIESLQLARMTRTGKLQRSGRVWRPVP